MAPLLRSLPIFGVIFSILDSSVAPLRFRSFGGLCLFIGLTSVASGLYRCHHLCGRCLFIGLNLVASDRGVWSLSWPLVAIGVVTRWSLPLLWSQFSGVWPLCWPLFTTHRCRHLCDHCPYCGVAVVVSGHFGGLWPQWWPLFTIGAATRVVLASSVVPLLRRSPLSWSPPLLWCLFCGITEYKYVHYCKLHSGKLFFFPLLSCMLICTELF